MKKVLSLVLFLGIGLSIGCTENVRVRNFGGEMTIEVPKGMKVINATWKHSDLFYFVEPMEENYEPKTKLFMESSSFGIIEGTIKFVESK